MITIHQLLKMKKAGDKMTALTAYDFTMAQLIDQAGTDIILVGDSVGTVVQGHDSTLLVTMEQMIYHTEMVARGVKNAMVIADLPFASYQGAVETGFNNAACLIRAGAQGVKMEGAAPHVLEVISRCVDAGILVVGHLGFTPQQVNRFGGHFIQGKADDTAKQLREDAQRLEEAGASILVLELIPAKLAETITKKSKIPTIGIGAGVKCDGQILVSSDLLGFNEHFSPKFLKKYAVLGKTVTKAVKSFQKEVRTEIYPGPEHSY